MISLHRVEGFYWVVRTGGFARAARAFPYPISQPGVHQQVRKLERSMGVRLVERVAKDRVAPTPAGRRLYDFAAPFFEQLPALVTTLQEGKFGGRLRVHAAGLIIRTLLPPWLARLQQRRPDIEVEVTEVGSADATVLQSSEADLLVDHIPSVPPNVVTRVVGRVHPFVVFPSAHKAARRGNAGLRDFSDLPFVAYPPDRRHRTLQMAALSHHGIQPRRTFAASTSDVILAFVASGLGYSIVPSLDPAGPHVPGVSARRLRMAGAEFPVHAAWRASGPPNPLLAELLELAPGTAR